jgi:hypothetical protein
MGSNEWKTLNPRRALLFHKIPPDQSHQSCKSCPNSFGSFSPLCSLCSTKFASSPHLCLLCLFVANQSVKIREFGVSPLLSMFGVRCWMFNVFTPSVLSCSRFNSRQFAQFASSPLFAPFCGQSQFASAFFLLCFLCLFVAIQSVKISAIRVSLPFPRIPWLMSLFAPSAPFCGQVSSLKFCVFCAFSWPTNPSPLLAPSAPFCGQVRSFEL